MNVTCNFLQNSLMCKLPPHTLDVMLKVQTQSGEHTFREDVYTRTLKYRWWNNQMKPFWSLKRRVASIFRRRRSSSNDSWGTSTQTVINQTERRNETDSYNSSDFSIHSDWSELLPNERDIQPSTSTVNNNANNSVNINQVQNTPIKRTMKNIVLYLTNPNRKIGEIGALNLLVQQILLPILKKV